MTDEVFIAMPVFRGVEFIEETLRSVLAQTYTDFHLVMSVDGPDDPSIEICQKYTDDPRIEVVIQESRLGWPGNFNWLVEHCDREFFCYWQQDDLVSTGYLENLRKELLARPDASICYTDVQWFGARFDRNGSPSIEGDPLSRVMQHIEAIRYEPLRGLMRASMLRGDREAIPVTEDESCQEEFVFLSDMAAAGAFIRVDSAMYFKRLHDDNAFARWARFPEWRRRRGRISMGAGMYEVARRLAPVELWPRVLAQLLDRLAVERHGRAHFYVPPQTPDELRRFVRDFVAYAELDTEDFHIAQPSSGGLERPVHPEIRRSLEGELAAVEERGAIAARLRNNGFVTIIIDARARQPLLGYGWSTLEPWGVWSDGEEATIRIPAPDGTSWRATIEARVFAPRRVTSVGYTQDRLPFQYLDMPADRPLIVSLDSEQNARNLVRFHLPNARAPRDEEMSDDSRKLGIGLTRIKVELTR